MPVESKAIEEQPRIVECGRCIGPKWVMDESSEPPELLTWGLRTSYERVKQKAVRHFKLDSVSTV